MIDFLTRPFPKRGFLQVDEFVKKIESLEKGKIKCLKLNEKEKKQLFKIEASLGLKLEKIFNITSDSVVFCVNFFLTNEGRNAFLKTTNLCLKGKTAKEVQSFFYKNRRIFKKIKRAKIDELAVMSRIYQDEKNLYEILATMKSNGSISMNGAENPIYIHFILNPQKSIEKIKDIRLFKKKLNRFIIKEKNDDFEQAKLKIFKIYNRRADMLLADIYPEVVWANILGKFVPKTELTKAELELAKQFGRINDLMQDYVLLDKYVHGVEYDANGRAVQIGTKFSKYASIIEKKYLKNEMLKKVLALKKGLDFEKIFSKKTFSNKKVINLVKEFIAFYEQKNNIYKSKLNMTVGWKFIASKRHTKMSINGKRKIISAPIRSRTIESVMAVVLGHEMTHFIQTLNQERIGLRLYKKVMGDRRLIFSEGGAMTIQDMVSRELFGYRNLPHVHYFKAMRERLNGGDYLACVKAFYESELKVLRLQKRMGNISSTTFSILARRNLKGALIDTKRIFKLGEDYASKKGILTKSKDLIYLEQYKVMQVLKRKGLDKFAYVRGFNLDSLLVLMEAGLLEDPDIKKPDLIFIKRLWKKEKSKYLIKGK